MVAQDNINSCFKRYVLDKTPKMAMFNYNSDRVLLLRKIIYNKYNQVH